MAKKKADVFSTEDNRVEEDGRCKDDGFVLNEKEENCLNWFVGTIKIEN